MRRRGRRAVVRPAERVAQLSRWHELARLIIGRAPRDAARVETLEQELLVALDEATREHESQAKLLATVDALIEEQGRTR